MSAATNHDTELNCKRQTERNSSIVACKWKFYANEWERSEFEKEIDKEREEKE